MLKIILISLIFVLSVIGISDILHNFWQLILRPKAKPSIAYVVYLNGKNDHETLCWVSDKMRWYGKSFADIVLAVKSSDTDEEIIKRFENIGITFINSGEITNFGAVNEQL